MNSISWGQSWRQKRQREEKNELDGQHQDSSGATNQHLRRVGPRSKEVARHDTQPRKREGTWIVLIWGRFYEKYLRRRISKYWLQVLCSRSQVRKSLVIRFYMRGEQKLIPDLLRGKDTPSNFGCKCWLRRGKLNKIKAKTRRKILQSSIKVKQSIPVQVYSLERKTNVTKCPKRCSLLFLQK